MVLVLAVAALPHFFRVPPWIPFLTLGVWGWTLIVHYAGFSWPNANLRSVLLLGGLGIVLTASGINFDLRTGVGLLLVLASFKPMEVTTPRGRLTTLLLAYFLAAINVLASQSINTALAMAVSVLTTTVALMHVNHPAPLARSKFRLSATLLIQALPLTTVLFVAFPRLPASMLGIPDIGVPMESRHFLAMDGMEGLVSDPTPVFRVEFEGPIPDDSLLYWRGYTLSTYIEGDWLPRYSHDTSNNNLSAGDSVNYIVTMEPYGERWLFTLDMPQASPPETTLLDDQTLALAEDLESPRRFSVTSALGYSLDASSQGRSIAYRHNLNLTRGNPRTRQLADQLAQGSQSDLDMVKAALDMLRSGDFSYSTAPLDHEENGVDTFLFETRSGFSTQYASAFAFLMRAAGVPCRVVIGYRGGELNPIGGYLIVRQSDAYAWNEVWIEGMGWVRVDPTAVVASSGAASGMNLSQILGGASSGMTKDPAGVASPGMATGAAQGAAGGAAALSSLERSRQMDAPADTPSSGMASAMAAGAAEGAASGTAQGEASSGMASSGEASAGMTSGAADTPTQGETSSGRSSPGSASSGEASSGMASVMAKGAAENTASMSSSGMAEGEASTCAPSSGMSSSGMSSSGATSGTAEDAAQGEASSDMASSGESSSGMAEGEASSGAASSGEASTGTASSGAADTPAQGEASSDTSSSDMASSGTTSSSLAEGDTPAQGEEYSGRSSPGAASSGETSSGMASIMAKGAAENAASMSSSGMAEGESSSGMSSSGMSSAGEAEGDTAAQGEASSGMTSSDMSSSGAASGAADAQAEGEVSSGAASSGISSSGEAEGDTPAQGEASPGTADIPAQGEASSGMSSSDMASSGAASGAAEGAAMSSGESSQSMDGQAGEAPSGKASPDMASSDGTSSDMASGAAGTPAQGEGGSAASMTSGESGQAMDDPADEASTGMAEGVAEGAAQGTEALSLDTSSQPMDDPAGEASPDMASGRTDTPAPDEAGDTASMSLDESSPPVDSQAPGEARDATPVASNERSRQMDELAQVWDAADYYWTSWVLDYTSEQQQSLFSSMGLDTDTGVKWWQAVLVGMALLGFFLGLALLRAWFLRGRHAGDPVREGYERFCYKLTLMNVYRPPHMGPRDLEAHIARQRSDMVSDTGPIIDMYVSLRYAGVKDPSTCERFTRAVAEFSPRPNSMP